MPKLTLVKTNHPATPKHHLQTMSDLAMKLLSIENGRDISLIMGYSIHVDNAYAIQEWINNFIENHTPNVNFKNDIYPALNAYLTECMNDITR